MFRSHTSPSFNSTSTAAKTHHFSSNKTSNPGSFLSRVEETIKTHPITILTGDDGCGKTSAMCYLEKKFSNCNCETILHLCGTTLDSVNPKKIIRRLIVELCRLLASRQEKSSLATTTRNNNFTSLENNNDTIESIETLLSAANSAPDEHLGEVILQALETYVKMSSSNGTTNISAATSSSSSSSISSIGAISTVGNNNNHSNNLIIFVDGVEHLFGSSAINSPIIQLLELLPLQSENLFPKVRFVFSFRRADESSSTSFSAKYEIITNLLESLSGGHDCFDDEDLDEKSSSSAARQSSSKSAKAMLVVFPLSLTKSSATKMITSQLEVLGKHWPRDLLQKSVSKLPGEHHHNDHRHHHHQNQQQSITYNFFASREAERKTQQALAATAAAKNNNNSNNNNSHLHHQDHQEEQSYHQRELMNHYFEASPQFIHLPPRTSLEASMLNSLFHEFSSSSSSSTTHQQNQKSHDDRLHPFGTPRYISVFIKELVATATFETLESKFNEMFHHCNSTRDLLRFIIARLSREFGSVEVDSIISCLLNTEIGVSEQEISQIATMPLRTVVAVLGSSGLRDFFIDRAGVLRGDETLKQVFFLQNKKGGHPPEFAEKMKIGCIRLFLQLLDTQREESIGRVCRELPRLFTELGQFRDLARFLSRHDVMREMFVASKKSEFLALWKLVLAKDSSISIDNKSWLFPVYEEEASNQEEETMAAAQRKRNNNNNNNNSSYSSSSSMSASITTPDHQEFYKVGTMLPTQNKRIESIILLSRLWGSFGKNASSIEMLKRCVQAVTSNSSLGSDEIAVENNNNNDDDDSDARKQQRKVLNSTKAQILQRLAQALVSEGKFASAVETVHQALLVAAPEQIPGLLKVLGRGFRKLGDYSQALTCFDKALENISSAAAASPSSTSKFLPNNNNEKIIFSKNALKTESTSKYFQKMDFDVASCLDEKGDILRKLDRNSDALVILKKSLALKKMALSSKHPAIASTLYSIAAAEKAQGQLLKSFSTVSEAIAIVENFYGPDTPKLYDLKFLQASCAVVLDHLPLALTLFKDLFEFCETHFGKSKLETAETMQQLANVYKKAGHVNKAMEFLPQAYQLLKNILLVENNKSDHPKLVKMLVQLADLERKVGRHRESLNYASEAVEMSKRMWEQDTKEEEAKKKKNQEQQQQQQQVNNQISKKLGGANSKEQEATKKSESEAASDNPAAVPPPKYDVQTAEALASLALAQMKQASTDEEFENIAKLAQSALAICEYRLGPVHVTTASCLVALGDAQRRITNQLLNALDNYQRALVIYENTFGKLHVEVTDALYKIGRCQKKMHWYARAQRSYEEAMNRMIESAEGKKSGGGGGSENGNSSSSNNKNIATLNALMMLKRSNNHHRHHHQLQNNHDDEDDDDVMKHPKMALFQQALGDCFRKQMEVDKARRLYELALETNRHHYGEQHEEIAECENGLAMCDYLEGRYEAALALEAKVVTMTIQLLGDNNRHSVNRRRNLQMIMDKILSEEQ